MILTRHDLWRDNLRFVRAKCRRINVDTNEYLVYLLDGTVEVFDITSGLQLFGPAIVTNKKEIKNGKARTTTN